MDYFSVTSFYETYFRSGMSLLFKAGGFFVFYTRNVSASREREDFLSQVDDDPPFLVTEGKTYGIP